MLFHRNANNDKRASGNYRGKNQFHLLFLLLKVQIWRFYGNKAAQQKNRIFYTIVFVLSFFHTPF